MDRLLKRRPGRLRLLTLMPAVDAKGHLPKSVGAPFSCAPTGGRTSGIR